MHYITAIHLTSTGRGHEHVASVRWLNSRDGVAGTSTIATMVAWLEKGNAAFVGGPEGRVAVGIVRPAGGVPYLRTHANGQWTDNLLTLPTF